MTPDEALNRLIEGNKRYIDDAPALGEVSRKRRLEIAKGQNPFATLVGCSDNYLVLVWVIYLSCVQREIMSTRSAWDLSNLRSAN